MEGRFEIVKLDVKDERANNCLATGKTYLDVTIDMEIEYTDTKVANNDESTMQFLVNHPKKMAQDASGRIGSLELSMRTLKGASTAQQP